MKEDFSNISEIMTVQKEKENGFNLQTTGAQRIYTVSEIMIRFMFI